MAWTKFPYPDPSYHYTAASLKKAWPRLHAGDCEPFPKEAALVEAWIAFHAGDFEKAAKQGMALGSAGWSVANKATCIYANYLEKSEAKKLAMFQEVAKRCEQQQAESPKDPAGYYWHVYALGRYSQGISVVKALSQGIGGQIKASLDKALKLAPKHADACIAYGSYHAEIIDKVGAMLGGLTYGAKRDEAVRLYKQALTLTPESPVARIEYADGLLMLEGKKKMKDAIALYEEAAACKPLDAMERLDVEAAKAELAD